MNKQLCKRDAVWTRLIEDKGFEEAVERHVHYLGFLVPRWDLPKPSNVICLPKSVKRLLSEVDRNQGIEDLDPEHCATLIDLLTRPAKCGEWSHPAMRGGSCGHCGSKQLTPLSAPAAGVLSRTLRVSLVSAESLSLVEVSRYRICLFCGFVMEFHDIDQASMKALRDIFGYNSEE